jgi:aspartyl-tRNA(Asn)/glutamyl-tRNA(Gln) amidotransferase subunit A
MLTVLAGPDEEDFDSAMREGEDYAAALDGGVDGLRLAVIPSLLEGSTDGVAENFERSLDALRGLGATIDRCEPMQGYGDWRGPLAYLLAAEAPTYILDVLKNRPQTISADIRERLQRGQEIKATDYILALQQRKEIERRFEEAIASFDAFLMPTSSLTAELIEEDGSEVMLKFRNCSTFDNTRQPATAVPNGFDAGGLPTSLMVVAAQFNDAMALRIAHAYQGATDFHTRRPEF